MNNKLIVLTIAILLIACSATKKVAFTDSRDVRSYKTVVIGKQTWMAENLNYNIPGSWCDRCSEYGRLYNYNTALKVCPTGWHLPSKTEWDILIDILDGENVAADKLKARNKWPLNPNYNLLALRGIPVTSPNNSSGFSAIPTSRRETDGRIYSNYPDEDAAYWWTSTAISSTEAWMWSVSSNTCGMMEGVSYPKSVGFTVRCLKDEPVEQPTKQTESVNSIQRSSSKTIESEGGIDLEMVLVKGGSFIMGCNVSQEGDCITIGSPAHTVILDDFYMSKYEITQRQWKKIMGSNPSSFSDCDECPVESVSWDDIREFMTKLNALSGKQYCFPTEAQWEYAAKGGSKSAGYRYSGSNTLEDVAWCHKNAQERTHPVGQKKPNELGFYDMTGNVAELTSDWQGPDFNYKNNSVNPLGWPYGYDRVFKGGSWLDRDLNSAPCCRDGVKPDFNHNTIGFRLIIYQ